MSLIGTEIAELRELHGQLLKGQITPKDCLMRLKIYKATAERERMILDMYKLSTLKGLSLGKISKSGLFDDEEVIPVSFLCRDEEKLDCPDMDRVVTRSECLDFSGEAANNGNCSSCPNYEKTRTALM